MLNNNYIREILGLEDVIIKDVKNIYGQLHIYLKMAKSIHKCPNCGEMTSKVHDYRTQIIKDIPAHGQYVYLHLKKRRHVCKSCKKRFYEQVSFLPKYHRMTSRFYAYIINQLREVYSYASVARQNNISGATVSRIFDNIKYPKPRLPKVLSIDEFKGNAEGEKFQCILTNPDKQEVLDILPKRRLDDLCGYFGEYVGRKDVKYVVMDMSTLFKSMAKSCFPKARIVTDKYHVVRQVTWALEAVRKSEQKKFSKDRRKYFKRSRHLLNKHSSKLTTDEQNQLTVMLSASQRLRIAYLIKTNFERFMSCKSKEVARKELSKWIVLTQSYKMPEFDNCCKAFINWSNEILEMFGCTYSNGYTEGMNNKIKVVKRNAYGVRNFERFRNRILHVTTS